VQPPPVKSGETFIQAFDRSTATTEAPSDITINQPAVGQAAVAQPAPAGSSDSEVDLGQKKRRPVLDRPPEIDADVTLIMPKLATLTDETPETGDFTPPSDGPDVGPSGTIAQEAETRTDTLEFEPDETGVFEDESG